MSSIPTSLAALVVIVGIGSGCTPTPKIEYRQGAKPFAHVVLSELEELEIFRFNEENGETWNARLVQKSGSWKLTDGGSGEDLLDKDSDEKFIAHFLETLKTLTIEERVNSRAATLGLEPPAIRLSWTGGATLITNTIELGRWENQGGVPIRYAKIAENYYVVRGAFLRMTDILARFKKLRNNRLSKIGENDVIAFEVFKNAKPTFFAQRLSGGWANRELVPISGSVNEWIVRLLHLQVDRFVDETREYEALSTRLGKDLPVYSVKLMRRKEKPIRFNVKVADGHVFATSSDRPNGLFELKPSALSSFAPPIR